MNRAVKKETLCFSITGEFVTNIARSWLYEERRPYTVVLNFLLNCMVGTKLKKATIIKYANDVLTGKKKFIGTTKDDSYCMVDDDTDVLTRYSLYFENIPKPEPVIEEDEDDEDGVYNGVKNIREYEKRMQKHITKDDYGWLSPEGKFTPVGWGSHDSWAREYINENYPNIDTFKPHFYCGDYLEKNGWILLHNPHMGAVEIPDWQLQKATKKQKEFLYDYFQEREMFDEARAVWSEL